MDTINLSDFARAIERQYRGMTHAVAEGYARIWAQETDPSLYPALQCWIDGKPVPNETHGEMSLYDIKNILYSDDDLNAILLISGYIRDPEAGLVNIMMRRS